MIVIMLYQELILNKYNIESTNSQIYTSGKRKLMDVENDKILLMNGKLNFANPKSELLSIRF